jgi:hypothetical protein
MPAAKAVLSSQVLEIRFDRGYRYYDRCGEVFLILEDVLTKETDKLWMVGEVKPQGAVLRCPDLDAVVVLDAKQVIVEQEPIVGGLNFIHACRTVWVVVETRLGITDITRVGSRRKHTVVTDTFDEAEALAVKHSPVSAWTPGEDADLKATGAGVTGMFTTDDQKRGVRVEVGAVMKIGTPLQIDERLKVPPHFLREGQHKALIAQLQRRKELEKNPDTGMVIDVDVFELFPEKFQVEAFLQAAHLQDERIRDNVLRVKS